MSEREDPPPAAVRPAPLAAVPFGAWLVITSTVVAAALLAHAELPRYEVRMLGPDGRAVLILDKWTGRMQRADFGPNGEPSLKGVIAPF
jgi:hypothetical protein